MDVSGTVITYNPDLKLLKDNLSAAIPQVSRMLVYDNGSGNVAELREMVSAFPSVELMENGENLGLPVNYNQAARKIGGGGGTDSDSWMLILDQDTVLPEGYVKAAGAFFDREEVSIICPLYWDINEESFEEFQKKMPSEETEYVERCISSGSICRVRDILAFGGFDEQMFIDYVDYDYCQTVLERGHKILRLNRYYIRHQIGNSRTVRFLGKPQIIHNHSPFRKYYFCRNRVYYARKHRMNVWKNRGFYKGFPRILLLTLLFEDDKWNKFRAMCKGFADGLRMKIDSRPRS